MDMRPDPKFVRESFLAFLDQRAKWSYFTFGSGFRTGGIIKHIQMELDEIKHKSFDLMEWVDIMFLAFDGAYRAGFTSEQVLDGLKKKLAINMARTYKMPTSQDVPVVHEKPLRTVRTLFAWLSIYLLLSAAATAIVVSILIVLSR